MTEPSLPQAASKSYAVLGRAFRFAAAFGQGDELRFRQALNWIADQRMPKRSDQQVAVRGLVRPDEVEMLTHAFLRQVEEMSDDETSATPDKDDQADAA